MALKVRVEELNNSRGVPATVLGASLLGLGMAVCGACPGTGNGGLIQIILKLS